MHKVARTHNKKWLVGQNLFYIMDFGEKISPRREGGFFFTVLTPTSGKE